MVKELALPPGYTNSHIHNYIVKLPETTGGAPDGGPTTRRTLARPTTRWTWSRPTATWKKDFELAMTNVSTFESHKIKSYMLEMI